ncbi:MAG TPA: acetolactate synthase small subunit, partial [Deinococcales bacterium]|nr:acetolactate synthase small subunit [Deinococcales bacterium]
MRVSGLFARRGYNIHSLSVGSTEWPGISRMTLVAEADESVAEQIDRQLAKLETVIRVINHAKEKFVDREMVLVKVAVPDNDARVEVRHIAEDFRARIVDVGRKSLILEVSGDEGKVTAFIEQMRPFGIIETMRTGRIALTRGSNADIPSQRYAPGPSEALESPVPAGA